MFRFTPWRSSALPASLRYQVDGAGDVRRRRSCEQAAIATGRPNQGSGHDCDTGLSPNTALYSRLGRVIGRQAGSPAGKLASQGGATDGKPDSHGDLGQRVAHLIWEMQTSPG